MHSVHWGGRGGTPPFKGGVIPWYVSVLRSTQLIEQHKSKLAAHRLVKAARDDREKAVGVKAIVKAQIAVEKALKAEKALQAAAEKQPKETMKAMKAMKAVKAVGHTF